MQEVRVRSSSMSQECRFVPGESMFPVDPLKMAPFWPASSKSLQCPGIHRLERKLYGKWNQLRTTCTRALVRCQTASMLCQHRSAWPKSILITKTVNLIAIKITIVINSTTNTINMIFTRLVR